MRLWIEYIHGYFLLYKKMNINKDGGDVDDDGEQITFPMSNSAQRASGPSANIPSNNSNLSALPSVIRKPARAKVILEPGHSPLDWASLTKSSSTEKLTVPYW
jgi:hypothetical protein